jgi:predicted ATPase
MGRHDEAERSLLAALDWARKQSALGWELRAALSLARLRVSRDRPGDARDILAPVYARFTEGFTTADLQEAKTLLDALA